MNKKTHREPMTLDAVNGTMKVRVERMDGRGWIYGNAVFSAKGRMDKRYRFYALTKPCGDGKRGVEMARIRVEAIDRVLNSFGYEEDEVCAWRSFDDERAEETGKGNGSGMWSVRCAVINLVSQF